MKALSPIVFIICVLFFSQQSCANLYGSYNSASYKIDNKKQSTKLTVRSSQQAASIARNRFGGKVLKVSRQQVNGHPGYRVKLVKGNGRVITVLIDAQTGRVSN